MFEWGNLVRVGTLRNDWSDMDEKKEALENELSASGEDVAEAAEGEVGALEEQAEQASEDVASEAESATPPVLDDLKAEAEAEVEAAEAEAETEPVDTEAEADDAEAIVAEADDAEENGEQGVDAPIAEEEDVEPESKAIQASEEVANEKPSSPSRTGEYIVVGIIALILGVLIMLPVIMGGANGGGDSSSSSSNSDVAATVNGTAISEDEVTEYVTKFRTQQGLESDADWGEWMVSYGYTPEALRSDTIEYFVSRELLKQAIAEQGIEVAESEVDDFIASITEQVGGEEAFTKALEAEGMGLEEYRQEIRFSLQQQALAKKVASSDTTVDDAQVLEIVKMYFPDSVDADAKSLDGVDPEVVDQIRSMLESSNMEQAFSDWMDDYRGKANIVIVDMPQSLPYAIDLTPYEKAGDQSDDAVEIEEASESSSASAEK